MICRWMPPLEFLDPPKLVPPRKKPSIETMSPRGTFHCRLPWRICCLLFNQKLPVFTVGSHVPSLPQPMRSQLFALEQALGMTIVTWVCYLVTIAILVTMMSASPCLQFALRGMTLSIFSHDYLPIFLGEKSVQILCPSVLPFGHCSFLSLFSWQSLNHGTQPLLWVLLSN